MHRFDISSSTCLWLSMVSLGFILYTRLFGRVEPRIRLMWCWMDLLGGRLSDICSGKTCSNRLRMTPALGCRGWFFSVSSVDWRIHSLKGLNSCYEALRVGFTKVSTKSVWSWLFWGLCLGSWCGATWLKWFSFRTLWNNWYLGTHLVLGGARRIGS